MKRGREEDEDAYDCVKKKGRGGWLICSVEDGNKKAEEKGAADMHVEMAGEAGQNQPHEAP